MFAVCPLLGPGGLAEVIIEALSLDVPVVSTDCPSGPREILHGGQVGRLVPVGDAGAFAGAMGASLAGPRIPLPPEILRPYMLDYVVDRYCQLIGNP